MPGAPLELHEREEIFRALVEDLQAGWAAIGRRVGRHPTTVAREINAGGGRERYGPAAAQRRAEVARRRARRRRLEAPGPLRDRICAELRRGRSPAAIRADLAADGVEAPPCVETVYQALYSGALDVKPCGCRILCRGWSGGISVLVDESVTAGRFHDLEVPIWLVWWVGGDGWSLIE